MGLVAAQIPGQTMLVTEHRNRVTNISFTTPIAFAMGTPLLVRILMKSFKAILVSVVSMSDI